MEYTEKYVNLLTDAGFKAVFGDPANKIVVKDFLNRILQGERVIEDFEYLNVEQIADLPMVGKSVRFDLCCRDTSGAQFIIEMQRCPHDEDFFERSVFYGALLFSRQLRRSERRYRTQPTYVIGIMEGALSHESASDNCLSRYEFANAASKVFGPKTIILIFVQLGLFDKQAADCNDILEQWMYSLKHSGAHTEQFENDEIERLLRASEIAGFDENKRLNYDQEMISLYDYEHDLYYSREEGREEGLKEGLTKGLEKGKAEGRAEGKAEGRAEGKVEVAKSLLTMGLPIEQVAQATGIPIEDLKALKA